MRTAQERVARHLPIPDARLTVSALIDLIDPANLRRAIREITASAGLDKKVNPYDMRRTMTSILSDEEVIGELITDVTGNDPSIALRIYRRRMRPVADAAVAPVNKLLAGLDDRFVDAAES